MDEFPSAADPGATPPTQTDNDRDRHFDLSLDLLCIAGLDGYFKQVNPSWTRVLGWSQSELLARPVADFIHPDDRAQTLQARAGLANGLPVRDLENRYLCKDGSYRWLSWQTSIAPGASTVFGVARDVTERRRIDQERLVLNKLESAGVLAGGIAHDFNNLLASLMLNLDLLGQGGSLNPEQAQHLHQAREIVRTAHATTQRLLTSATGAAPVRKLTDLGNLLRLSLEIALMESNLRRELNLAPDLWPAEVDEDQIAQVIRGVIMNAREAMPQGGTVQLHASNVAAGAARARAVPAGDFVRIDVVDDGPGIAPEILPKIFDPYFSTKQRSTQKGMGLGLTICRSIVQKHGGVITVDSCAGSGTTVRCYLPAARKPARPSDHPAEGAAPPAP